MKKQLTFAFGLCLLTSSSQAGYLFAPTEGDNAAFRAQVAAILGDTVDYFDASSATPTLALLAAYDGVFTWTNFSYANSVLFGDNLADYVDGGGRVVLGAFTPYTSGNFLGGRIMTSGYSPVKGGTNTFTSSDYSGDGTGSLWDGVDSYSATYRDNVVLQGDGIANGTFLDGVIAAAYRPGGRVVYLGGMETLDGSKTGDSAQLLANALRFTGKGGEPEVPEPSSILLTAFGAGMLGMLARRRASR